MIRLGHQYLSDTHSTKRKIKQKKTIKKQLKNSSEFYNMIERFIEYPAELMKTASKLL